MEKNRYAVVLGLFLFLSNLSFSQQKSKDIYQSEFDKYFLLAQKAFDNSDYFRAKNLYDYCSKMIHPKSKEALKKKDFSVTLWIENATANRKLKEGNIFEAQKILNKILAFNPNDKTARRDLLALNNNERIYENFKRHKEIPNLAQNSVKKSSSGSSSLPSSLKPKIASTEKQSKTQTLAVLPPRNDNAVTDEFAKGERERINKVEREKKEFIEFYTKGIIQLGNCNYKESLKFFTKAHRLKPNAFKTKRFYYSLLVLETKDIELNKLLINSKNYFEYICNTFEQIIKINKDLEAIQSGSSCKNVGLEYATFLKNQLPLNADKYNCDKIISITNKIETLSDTVFKESVIQNLIKSCVAKNNPCQNTILVFNQKLYNVNAKYNTADYRQAQEAIQTLINEIEISKNDCKDIDFGSVSENAISLRERIDLGIKNFECNETQKKNFEIVNDLFDKNQIEKTIDLLDKLDTTCVDNFFKNTIKRQRKLIEYSLNAQLLRTFEDSAKLSHSSKEYSQARTLYNAALQYSRTKSDSARIEKGFWKADCLSKNKNPKRCMESPPQGKCDTMSFNSMRLNFGRIGGSSNHVLFRPTLFIDGERIDAMASPQFFIGLTYLKTNYAKIIDHGVSLNYFSNQTIDFNRQNQSSLFSFQSSSVAFGYEQKYHRRGFCLNKPRVYGKLGLLVNYNFVEYKNPINSSTYQFITSNYSKSIGTTFMPGFGFEIPNKNVSLEFFAFRMARLKSPLSEIQYPWSSNFVNGGLGIKFNYGFKL
jgi:tetratricopeptide (TPR) repeat protein